MYLALYRKYRPRTFDDVISQEHITTTLKNQLKNGQSSHAYLFTGSRGTGKTTCAKILAKALNCTNLKDGNPCLECASCRSIDEDYTDITEIDAASNNGVDDIRNLKEESFYAPMSGKFKVYIIDEVHMLSISAFNALLKLIEEPPAHVVFIFATTEVHKVPATILSRCQRFEFRRIDINESKKRLQWVAEQENKKLSDDAAFLISKISEGGMRDALSLLDQCFSVSDDVTEEIVRECAGISGSDYLLKIADLINSQNIKELLILLDELISRSKDVTRLCEELISHYRSLMLIKSGADNLAVGVTSTDFIHINKQCEQYSLEQIMRCISILSETFSSMSRVRNPALYLEMCFIRLCTPKLDTDERSLSARIDRLEQIITSGSQAAPPIYYNSIPESSSPSPTPSPVKPVPEQSDNTSREDAFRIDIPEKLVNDKTAADADDLKSAVFGTRPEKSTDIKANDIPPPTIESLKEQYSEDPVPVPDNIAPLSIWQDIIDTLPISVKLGIEGTSAYISGNSVYVDGGGIAVGLATGDYREQVRNAASKAIGRNVSVFPYEKKQIPDNNDRSSEKLSEFLDRARSFGITIKEQN